MDISIIQILVDIILGTVIFLHISKKNFPAVLAYSLQSLMVVAILMSSFVETGHIFMLFVILSALLVKVILTPVFFIRLINKNKLQFSVSTYLNTPLSLITIAIITLIAYSHKLESLTNIVPANHAFLSLMLSSVLLSIFLLINRKGALSQIIGILSLENSIVVFSIFAGLEQSPELQLGILFNIFIWMMIATVFMSMILRHFGSLNITAMNKLKD